MPAPVRRKLLVLCLLAGMALALAGGAFAADTGLTPVEPSSPNASRIDSVYVFIGIFTGAILVLVEGLLIFFAVRFRRRGRPREAEGPQIRGHTRLELAWTAVPVLILAAIASFVFYKLPGIKDVPAASAGERVSVRVDGRQFYWQFTYPNGAISIDRLRVPLGKVITLDVTANPSDVIHSWWVPALGGKIDAIPGQVNHTWFRAGKLGTYRGQCAEFCGIQHAQMPVYVDVVPAAEYRSWVSEQANAQKAGTSDLGAQEWNGVCAKCHRISPGSERLIGPNLGGNPLLTDRNGLETLVHDGRGLMPAVGKGWTDEQFSALFDYIKSHVATQGGAASGG
jgi:cytochrome c oxidase subunit 2